MQILEPGEDVKFSQPADVGASYADFLRGARLDATDVRW